MRIVSYILFILYIIFLALMAYVCVVVDPPWVEHIECLGCGVPSTVATGLAGLPWSLGIWLYYDGTTDRIWIFDYAPWICWGGVGVNVVAWLYFLLRKPKSPNE